ncbi:MAG: hypothetical protein ABSG03_35170 [Bryobacteraceae bacterium]|jgi:hypothetical protein
MHPGADAAHDPVVIEDLQLRTNSPAPFFQALHFPVSGYSLGANSIEALKQD